MRGARADARGERVRDRLDDLLEYLGESYCNLAGSNAALDTVNTDIDACVSFLLRRERRAARDTVTPAGGAASSGAEQASDLQGEAGAPTAPELPDEIEKILAKLDGSWTHLSRSPRRRRAAESPRSKQSSPRRDERRRSKRERRRLWPDNRHRRPRRSGRHLFVCLRGWPS